MEWPLSIKKFEGAPPETNVLICSGLMFFIALFLMEPIFFRLVSIAVKTFAPDDPDLAPAANRDAISKRLLEATWMGVFAVIGCQLQADMGWSVEEFEARFPDQGRRLLHYPEDGGPMRLILMQFAYQAYNLISSLRDGDETIFIVHHLACVILFFLCLHPFNLIYVPVMLGLLEISSVPLCIMSIFSPECGVENLGKRFPKTKTLCGGMFVVSFLWFRIFKLITFTKPALSDLYIVLNIGIGDNFFHGLSVLPRDFVVKLLIALQSGFVGLQLFWGAGIVAEAYGQLFASRQKMRGKPRCAGGAAVGSQSPATGTGGF